MALLGLEEFIIEDLLYSLSEFFPITSTLLGEVAAKRVAEIGAFRGDHTELLGQWADNRGVRIFAVDPVILPSLLAVAEAHRCITLCAQSSFDFLSEAHDCDVFIIDSDHNYYTLKTELGLIVEHSAPSLIVLHDVGWPLARRDLYYAPVRLPPEAKHPYTYESGVTLDNPYVIEHGFRGNGEFALALHEGGPRNGLLTAVEDFLSEHTEFQFFTIQAIFGYGVLVRRDHPARSQVESYLQPFTENYLLEMLERNRLHLYLHLIEASDYIALLEKRLADLEPKEES